MQGDLVPDPHHITRYCGGSHVHEDGTIDGTAFRLKEKSGKPESYLSTNWLEYLSKESRPDEINEIRKVLASKMRTIGSTAKIAVLNVGRVLENVSDKSLDKHKLQVVHEPDHPADPSHSGIYGFRIDDDLITDLIAEVVNETHSAKL